MELGSVHTPISFFFFFAFPPIASHHSVWIYLPSLSVESLWSLCPWFSECVDVRNVCRSSVRGMRGECRQVRGNAPASEHRSHQTIVPESLLTPR